MDGRRRMNGRVAVLDRRAAGRPCTWWRVFNKGGVVMWLFFRFIVHDLWSSVFQCFGSLVLCFSVCLLMLASADFSRQCLLSVSVYRRVDTSLAALDGGQGKWHQAGKGRKRLERKRTSCKVNTKTETKLLDPKEGLGSRDGIAW
ncbi:hypothetical protein IWZ01DRAFT_498506 [Phyllosticta capitalensis]